MFFRYLKLIFALTIFTYAAPNAFDSLGNELEAFQKDCKYFEAIPNIPTKIKKECKVFARKVNSAFKIGYKLDSLLEKDKADDKKINQYLTLLRKIDVQKEKILNSLQSEKKKARKSNNITYYAKLIANRNIELYSSDYEFMKEHIDIFSNNKRYQEHKEYLEYLKKQEQQTKKRPVTTAKKQQKNIKLKNKNDYGITAIKKIEVYETNTDSDPQMDDAKIYVVFGNEKGEDVRPPNGVSFDYSIAIYKLIETGNFKEVRGQQLAFLKGKLISDNGFTYVFVKLPQLNNRTRLSVETQVRLSSGKVLNFIDNHHSFNP